MDKFTFISNLASSIAWPVTAIVGFLMLREPVAKAISLIKNIRYKDMDVEFSEIGGGYQALDAVLGSILHHENHMLVPIESLFEIARVSPKVAVIEAGRSLNYELDRSVDRFLGSSNEVSENADNSKESKESLLSNPAFLVMGKLLQLREDLLANPRYEVTEKNARKYILAVNKYCGLVKSIHLG